MFFSGEGTELKPEVDRPDQLIKNLQPRRFHRQQAIKKLAMESQQGNLTFRLLSLLLLSLLSRRKTVAVPGYSTKAGLIGKLLRVQHLGVARSWRIFEQLIG